MRLFTASVVTAVVGLAAGASCLDPTPVQEPEHVDNGWATKYTRTDPTHVKRAAATALTRSPTSTIRGTAFMRMVTIFFENQNFAKSIDDPNFAWFAKKGITLTNYFGVTHPSQPNYMAAIAGDYFGMNHDAFVRAPRNVSTIIDLLEAKGITWGHYQENMPYSGFEGMHWTPRDDRKNPYVRKHNPAIMHDSVAESSDRLALIKNLSLTHPDFSMFHRDLRGDFLPQWSFITPGMWSDGHDSDITTAGEWLRKFLEPLLEDRNFMKKTMVVITFDESETYTDQNRVLALLLGDAIPKNLIGTEDPSFYNHYSLISTAQANWRLRTLGRWDVGANVFRWVGEQTGDLIRGWPSAHELSSRYFNVSYAGAFHDTDKRPLPPPNIKLTSGTHGGRVILGKVWRRFVRSIRPTYYEDTVQIPDGLRPPRGYEPSGTQ